MDDELLDPRSAPPAARYEYFVPANWVSFDLDPAHREASVRTAVRERVRREPRLAPHLAQLDRYWEAETLRAAATGVRRLSLLAEPLGDGVLTAALTAAEDGYVEDGVRCVPDAFGIAAGLPADVGAGEEAGIRDEVIALLQVAAVKRTYVETMLLDDGTELPSQVSQLHVPWPGRPEVVVLTLASPVRAAWQLMDETFEAIGATFHFDWD